jgi:hypothetical protein
MFGANREGGATVGVLGKETDVPHEQAADDRVVTRAATGARR